jgi:hypothetical protein
LLRARGQVHAHLAVGGGPGFGRQQQRAAHAALAGAGPHEQVIEHVDGRGLHRAEAGVELAEARQRPGAGLGHQDDGFLPGLARGDEGARASASGACS